MTLKAFLFSFIFKSIRNLQKIIVYLTIPKQIKDMELTPRQTAFAAHYKGVNKYASLSEAQLANKGGYWTCKVRPLTDEAPFYVLHTFLNGDMYAGMVIGMWNELTLIERK